MRYPKFLVWADSHIIARFGDYDRAELYARRIFDKGMRFSVGVIDYDKNEFIFQL